MELNLDLNNKFAMKAAGLNHYKILCVYRVANLYGFARIDTFFDPKYRPTEKDA